jgi:hypothetical protein
MHSHSLLSLGLCAALLACSPQDRLPRCLESNPLPDNQEEQWALGCRIPGFGGFALDRPEMEPGVQQRVYLTDLAEERRARKVLAPFLRGLPLDVRQGQYTFADLQDWKARSYGLSADSAVVFSGISLDKNRLVVGISEPAAAPRVQSLLPSLGIPREAVIFEQGGKSCTTEYRFGLGVQLQDSITGQFIASGARLILRDGEYVDTVQAPANRPDVDSLAIPAAGERPGVYTLTVQKPGYREWTRFRVRVTADRCHVQPVRVTARLQPR